MRPAVKFPAQAIAMMGAGSMLIGSAERAGAHKVAKQVVFLVDYGMVSHGLAPLFIDGHATELEFWGFSGDIVRRLTRLNELYDRQINWDNPGDPDWRLSERDRTEFNALLLFVVAEVQMALGDGWELVVDSGPL